MSRLVDELVSEIYSSNPDLTAEEITDQIVLLVEDDVLPSAIAKLRLPKLPSPIELRVEELRQARRHGKKNISEWQKRVGFLQDLEKLRNVNYQSDFTFAKFRETNPLRESQKKPSILQSNYWKKIEKTLPFESEILPLKQRISPVKDVAIGKTLESFQMITFDSFISKKIAFDPFFENAIASIEHRLRQRFTKIPNIGFSFVIRKDLNEPDKSKTVISVKIPNISFKEKMNYWVRIDFEVRKTIKTLSLPEAEKKAITRNIVIHVESD